MVKGSCLCGKVGYEVELLEGQVFNCHCQFCRKAHGAAFATLALADGATLTITRGGDALTEHLNDIGGYRAFCSHCGTRLMNYGPDKTQYLSVTASTIDEGQVSPPGAHVNVESKASWHEPSSDIPSFSGLPPGVG